MAKAAETAGPVRILRSGCPCGCLAPHPAFPHSQESPPPHSICGPWGEQIWNKTKAIFDLWRSKAWARAPDGRDGSRAGELLPARKEEGVRGEAEECLLIRGLHFALSLEPQKV